MKRFYSIGLAVVTLALLAISASKAEANAAAVNAGSTRGINRQAIKQMPLLERPDRPGHIYGNTVRRMNRMRGR